MNISEIADWSSLVSVVLAIVGIVITIRISKKVDNIIKKQMEEFGKALDKAKIENKGYDADELIKFDERIPNNKLYEETIRNIDNILHSVIEHKIYDESGRKIVDYTGYNNSIRAKGNIMLLEIQYLNERLKNSGMDYVTLMELEKIKKELLDHQKKVIPW